MIATVSLAKAKQLCHVDELGDDRKSSLTEPADQLVPGAIVVYGSHTSGPTPAEGGAIEPDFRRRHEEKFADARA